MTFDRPIEADEVLKRPESEQQRRGYFHTLREICQQPLTIIQTSEQLLVSAAELKRCVGHIHSLVLTGSGSSEYAGECVRLPLQNELKIITQAIGGGALLTHGSRVLPPGRPALMVSLARSGDSPESVGALSLLLEIEPKIRHLVITCNANGTLGRTFTDDPRVTVITLDDRTNDRSLVMTSSFTSMLVAARFIGLLEQPEGYDELCVRLSRAVEFLIRTQFGTFANVAALDFQRAVFLGSGARYAAAREAALKMLEMTAGRVSTLAETYLGFRHGPMSYVNENCLVVCFFSLDPLVRAYETDLIHELERKKLGFLKVVIGEKIPRDLIGERDVAIECEGLTQIGDENACVVDVVAGQLLAFFRCMELGLRPDSPSESGVINRVVENFALHYPKA